MTNVKVKDEDERKLRKLFFDIINEGSVTTVFQPIISLRDGAAYGYEALTRGPQNTELHSPIKLFEYAQKYEKIWELEMLCRSKAFESCNVSSTKETVQPPNDIKLFLNVNPNIMDDMEYKKGFTKEYIEKYSLNPENIIFEITEREAINNVSAFKNTVQNYKKQDYRIAIDDAGAGYCGLNMISDVHPHFIKLDMNLIRNIDKDVTKESLIKSMCEFASLTNTYLIAEGIETQKELEKLIEVGVHYGQGYFIQKPNVSIIPISCDVTKVIHRANSKKNHIIGSRISDIYISNICTPIQMIDSEMCISEVNEKMNSDYSIPGFCITRNDHLVGVITRNDLHLKLSGLYGYSLNCNKPINKIMNKNYMRVDYKTPIDIVAKVAMQRENDKLYDFITITKEEKYLGIVTVKDLLQKTIQIEVINAKHLNPLSELPGNVLIEKYLEKCIYSHKDYCVLYFDLDNFKVYNDVYGFEKGDVVIKRLTKILKANIPRDEFVGHLGGDDFIAVLFSTDRNELCNKIIKDFDDSIQEFYNEDDIRKGYIVGKSRKGVEEKFSLLSLSIAGVTNNYFKDIYDLSEKASQIKNMCKQNRGSNYIIV